LLRRIVSAQHPLFSRKPSVSDERTSTDSIRTITGTIRTSTPTGAIRTLGADPATAPIVLHPGDAISHARRVLYIIVLGALTALGPFTIDLYLPAFPQLEEDFATSAAMIQLTLTGTMIGFALGQLVVGPVSDKVGRRVPLIVVTARSEERRVGKECRCRWWAGH